MNIWHDIDEKQIQADNFTAVIEISKGGKAKYELDKKTGLLRLDRVLYTATHYPQNYGFIPLTYGEDNDPLDVLVLCSEPILPMTLVQCYPIGVISMVDNGSSDEKIIAIPFSDPTYNVNQSIDDLPRHVFSEMEHFFAVYKQLENKDTAVDPVRGRRDAIAIIQKAMERYREMFRKNWSLRGAAGIRDEDLDR